MSKQKPKLTSGSPREQLAQFGQTILRYRVVLFVLLIAGLYGFVNYRIQQLTQMPVSDQSVQQQVTNTSPRIDKAVVRQLESLKDNSVSVKTLFDNARQNPFAE
jgi:hypothetical protein